MFVDGPGAVQSRDGSFDESETGGSVVYVDNSSPFPETFFPNDLRGVAWQELGLSHDLLLGPVVTKDRQQFRADVKSEGPEGLARGVEETGAVRRSDSPWGRSRRGRKSRR